jgi:thiosulfate/3-mercaptopyruvate sulfurtransferase
MSAASAELGPLVSTEWLLEHVADASLVLLDARVTRVLGPGGRKQYVADPQRYEVDGHIPGAQFVDLKTGLSDPSSGLNFTLPSATALETAFRELGVRDDSAVVAYDDDTGIWAARIWWLLRSLGHRGVAVLNGGLRAWVAAGGELDHAPGAPATAGDLVADPQPGFFIGHEDVKALSASPQAQTLLCALDHDVFTGERRSGASRDGHIPGSASFPYAALVDDHGLIDPSRVAPELAGAGIDAHAPLVTYCGGGVTACGVALALAAAGHTNVAIYDGSLQQWAADDGTAMAIGER